jgi:hypothetical protein
MHSKDTKNPTQQTRLDYFSYAALALFIVLHVLLSVVYAPPPSGRLGLSPTMTYVIRFSLLPIYWAAWFFGLKSVIVMRRYAESFHEIAPVTKIGLQRMSYGLLALTTNLAVAAITSASRNLFDIASPMTKWLTITVNYLYIVFPLLGLWFIFTGAQLIADQKLVFSRQRDNVIIAVFFSLIVTTFYALLIFSGPNRQVALDPAIRAAYFISDTLIFLTIVIPSFAVWMLGMLAAFQIENFLPEKFSAKQLRARQKFVSGIWAVIFSAISIQVILALGSRAVDLGLAFILLVVYGILIFLAYAYFLVMRGAQGLLSDVTPPEGG